MKETPANSVVYLDGGHGVWFFCPGCQCHHRILDNRWSFNGDPVKPTITPSILCQGAIRCHSYVTDGRIRFLSDCEHKLAGQTVDLEPFDGWDQADKNGGGA